jgi:NAD(P)H dehydrogenase (quinone)
MKRLMDDFGFRYPGIKNVEHVYFYSVGCVDLSVRQGYLQQAYCLGKEFAVPETEIMGA